MGDDLNRGVKKFNRILDLVADDSVPKVNRLLDAGDGTLQAATGVLSTTDVAVTQLSDKAGILLDDSNETVKEFKLLLADENVKRTLQGMADTSEQAAIIASNLKLTTYQVNEYLPALLTALKDVSENTADGTKQLATLLGTFNEKPTKLQRIYRALITFGVIAVQAAR
jgi:hypothetical protein